jgi:ribonuclease Z
MSFSVTILGSSSALPTSKRYLTAHLVNHDERFFLIDCGEGTQIQLRRFKKKTARINHIFISHLHGDHVFGIFGLISSFSMMGLKNALHIYSHPNLEKILNTHLSYFNDDIRFPIVYHSIGGKKSQVIYSDKKIKVSTIPLKHRIPCIGFLFNELPKPPNINKNFISAYLPSIKEIIEIKNGSDYIAPDGKLIKNSEITAPAIPPKSYAFCTDTKATESIVPLILNINVLFHETTFLETDTKLAKKTYHSTTKQAADLAKKANVGKLVIGHFSSRYKNENSFIDEARQLFPNTIMAEDGLEIMI